MAEVWLATDTSLSRQVAVKVLKSGLATDPVVAERFRREAITVARLSHPNIVAVHDTIDFDGRQAVVMQLINGKSLRQLLDEQKRLGPELTMHIGACVAAALDAAHSAGLVHRDVKPGNILITPDGRVLLADFGIAKGLGSTDDLTSENVMMGTAKYLSPEQVRGKKLDGRADLYALGLVLYECLAGRVPFLGESDADTALARLQRDPTDLTRLRPTLPFGLANLIHRLLARNPDDRPATGGELKASIARIASGVDDPTTTLTPPRGTTMNDGAASTAVRDSTPNRAAQPIIRTEQRGDRPSTPTPRQGPPRPINAPPPTRDRTPTSGSPRGVPARHFQQKRTPTIVVMLLLLVAVIVTALLWPSENSTKRPSFVPPTSLTAASSAQPAAVAATITSISSFDPDDADEGTENPDQVALAIDSNPNTAWSTNCYASQYFGGKAGVGLVIELSASTIGTVSVSMKNAPYQLEVFASNADTVPPSVESWGEPVQAKSHSTTPGTITATINGEPARYVLVLLYEVGGDNACSTARPYRGSVSEITWASAG
jgi:serine/threonine-protein kinase